MREALRTHHKKVTQAEIAERAGIPFPTYQKIESGNSWPEAENLEKIAEALGTTVAALFTAPAPRPTPEQALEVLKEALLSRPASKDSAQKLYQAAEATPDLGEALGQLPIPPELRDFLAQQAQAWLRAHRGSASESAPASRKSRKSSE